MQRAHTLLPRDSAPCEFGLAVFESKWPTNMLFIQWVITACTCSLVRQVEPSQSFGDAVKKKRESSDKVLGMKLDLESSCCCSLTNVARSTVGLEGDVRQRKYEWLRGKYSYVDGVKWHEASGGWMRYCWASWASWVKSSGRCGAVERFGVRFWRRWSVLEVLVWWNDDSMILCRYMQPWV